MSTCKHILWVFCLVLFFTSCKDKGIVSTSLTGGANEVLFVVDKAKIGDAYLDSVKNWFRQPMAVLPQGEATFNVVGMSPQYFKGRNMSHRAVIEANISPDVKQPGVIFKDSPWVKTQQYYLINARDQDEFICLFDEYKQTIMETFESAERQRKVQALNKLYKPEIDSLLRKDYHLSLKVPNDYFVNKDTAGFVWISKETRKNSRGIVLFTAPYIEEAQFEDEKIIALLKAKLSENIPGPIEGSYMSLDEVTPMTFKRYSYRDKHYAVLIKGLWIVENDYMGGPFILNTVLDEANNRIIYLMGYVYAPNEKKRDMIRQVEAMVFSLEF